MTPIESIKCPFNIKIVISGIFTSNGLGLEAKTWSCAFRVYKNLNLGEALTGERCEKIGFCIDFEEGCFGLLSLFHLRKKHVLITCSRILLNIK